VIFDSRQERRTTLFSVIFTVEAGLAVLAAFYALSSSVAQNPIPYIWGMSAIVVVPILAVLVLIARRLWAKSKEFEIEKRHDA